MSQPPTSTETAPTEPFSAGADRILVKDLLVRGILGLNDWEREKQQDILINLTVFMDIRRAGKSDDVAHTLNYRTLTKAIIRHVEGSQPYLVEKLVTDIARICIVDHGAPRAIVRAEKPGALRFAESVGVEIDRSRADFPETAALRGESS